MHSLFVSFSETFRVSPPTPPVAPIALKREASLVTGVAIILTREIKRLRGCADAIAQYDDLLVATGQPNEQASTWNVFCQENAGKFPILA